MRDYWINQWYSSEKKARIGIMQAGYMPRYVEIYQEGTYWRFRLNEAGLADQAASLAEAPPMKKLPDHLKLKERKSLDDPHQPKRLRLQRNQTRLVD